MKAFVLQSISGYQRYISRYKGFGCAYRCYRSRSSCLVLGYRAIRRHGVFAGIAILRRRLERCSVAYKRYGKSAATINGQGGFCDLGCVPFHVPCDIPGIDCPVGASDALTCFSVVPCDRVPWNNSRSEKQGNHAYIPPKRWPQDEDSH